MDNNKLETDGFTRDVMNVEPIAEKFRAFGWNAHDINGHDFAQIHQATQRCMERNGKPSVIVADTIKGKGISFMEGDHAWHSGPTNPEQTRSAVAEIEGGRAMIQAQSNRVMDGKMIAELGASDDRIVVLDADISKSTNTFHFAKVFPHRFFNMGTAEQNLISFAAGLATTGKIPFASTFAVFASLRAGEQVRSSVCYPRLNVKIVATNAGVEICGDGPTHQACEDLAVMRAMPNLIVLSPSDPITTRLATEAIAAYNGPVYMRLGRQDAKVLHNENVEFALGKTIRLREDGDLSIIACVRSWPSIARVGCCESD